MSALKPKHATKSNYEKAVAFYEKGKMKNAEKLCKQEINIHGPNYKVYNLLGLMYQKSGAVGLAFSNYTKALKLAPSCAVIHNNMGIMYDRNGSYQEAESCFKNAIRLDDNNAEYPFNLACVLERNKSFDEAIALYKNAIEIDRHYGAAYHNIGQILFNRGEFDAALEYYNLALLKGKNSVFNEIYTNIPLLMLFKEGAASWRVSLLSMLSERSISYAQKGEILTSIEIANWLTGLAVPSLKNLDQAKYLLKQDTNYRNTKNMLAYNNTLRELVAWYEHNPDKVTNVDKTIYFIGDSHTLTCANKNIALEGEIYNCKSVLIKGCKIWHLVKEDGGKMRSALNLAVDRLPKNSTVIMCFGEIDCRYDEGLFLRYRKYAIDLEAEVKSLLDSYFSKVISMLLDRGYAPLIWGVPAPHQNIFDSFVHHQHKDKFKNFVKYYNHQLELRAAQFGCRFVDNYKATANSLKISDDNTHIDSYHMRPDVFVKEIAATWTEGAGVG